MVKKSKKKTTALGDGDTAALGVGAAPIADAAAVAAAGEETKPRKKKRRQQLAASSLAAEAVEVAEKAGAEDDAAHPPRKKNKRCVEATDIPANESTAAASRAAEDFLLPGKAKKGKAKAEQAEQEPQQSQSSARASPKDAVDSTIFIDGLPYTWSVDQINAHFAECGAILDVRAPTWQDSGRLRGFAHVTFSSKAARDKALKMDGSQVGNRGRYLKIEVAKPPAEAGASIPADKLQGKRRLFVKNLPYDVTEADLSSLFSSCGKIVEIRIPSSFGRSKGFAYIEFARYEHLQAAAALRPAPALKGRTLQLDVDDGLGPRSGFKHMPDHFVNGTGRGNQGKGKGKGKDKGKSKDKRLSLF